MIGISLSMTQLFCADNLQDKHKKLSICDSRACARAQLEKLLLILCFMKNCAFAHSASVQQSAMASVSQKTRCVVQGTTLCTGKTSSDQSILTGRQWGCVQRSCSSKLKGRQKLLARFLLIFFSNFSNLPLEVMLFCCEQSQLPSYGCLFLLWLPLLAVCKVGIQSLVSAASAAMLDSLIAYTIRMLNSDLQGQMPQPTYIRTHHIA